MHVGDFLTGSEFSRLTKKAEKELSVKNLNLEELKLLLNNIKGKIWKAVSEGKYETLVDMTTVSSNVHYCANCYLMYVKGLSIDSYTSLGSIIVGWKELTPSTDIAMFEREFPSVLKYLSKNNL